jgi:hypothetical protein
LEILIVWIDQEEVIKAKNEILRDTSPVCQRYTIAADLTKVSADKLYYVRLHAHNKTHAKTQRRKESKNILLWVCYRT